MCGIIGMATAFETVSREFSMRQRDTMAHRGPDNAGFIRSADGRVFLAHRRLAIIDLSPAGHQPMLGASGQTYIVFNGEIYNYRELRRELETFGHLFNTSGDTEVLLAAYDQWGINCLDRLNGMFAFALYDQSEKKLLLARDRAGEKPLFYTISDGTISFASELKALLADPDLRPKLDPESFDCYLAMGYVPGERCIIKGFNKLPPAHYLLFDLSGGQTEVKRYWRLPDLKTEQDNTLQEADLLDNLEKLLCDAVQKQLVADVPVGILLSGGIDSSLITATAVKVSDKIDTFTIRFPGYGEYDETKHARLISNHFGTNHTELEASESTVNLLETLARQYDEPIVDSSMIPTFLVSQLIRKHCTVALGGDGGDELFGGYPHYDRLLQMHEIFGAIPCAFRRLLSAAGKTLPIGFKGRNWYQELGVDFKKGLPFNTACFDRAARRRLISHAFKLPFTAEKIRFARLEQLIAGCPSTANDLLQRSTRMDFENFLPEDILVKVDRASMLNSLEIRAPFLDYRIIEFAFGKVPSKLKATTSDRKILLKKLCTRLLPPEFDRQRKQGFSIPLGKWLQKGPWHDYFHDILLGNDSGVFDKRFVRKLFDAQRRGRSNSERLFALALFELWRKEYGIRF